MSPRRRSILQSLLLIALLLVVVVLGIAFPGPDGPRTYRGERIEAWEETLRNADAEHRKQAFDLVRAGLEDPESEEFEAAQRVLERHAERPASAIGRLLPFRSWRVRVLLCLFPALFAVCLWRSLREKARRGAMEDARARFVWAGTSGATAIAVVLVLPATFVGPWGRPVGPPLANAAACVAVSIAASIVALVVVEALDQRWRGYGGPVWKNVLPRLYFNTPLLSMYLIATFVPLGAVRLEGLGELVIDWRLVAAFLALLAGLTLFRQRLAGVLLGLERPAGEKLARVAARHRGKFSSCGELRTFGAPLANALAVFPGRRIVFTEAALDALTEAEVDGIFCHELGHLEHRSEAAIRLLAAFVWPAALFGTLASAPVLYSWHGPVRAHPVSGLVVLVGVFALLIAATQLFLRLSRRWEERADRFAIEQCVDPEALASALRTMSRTLGLPDTFDLEGRETQTHPSLARRIEAIYCHPRIAAENGDMPHLHALHEETVN